MKDVTPEETWSCNKPSIGYLRVFGYDAHVPTKRKKIDLKRIKCIFVGYCEGTKVYQLYDLARRVSISSCDVIF